MDEQMLLLSCGVWICSLAGSSSVGVGITSSSCLIECRLHAVTPHTTHHSRLLPLKACVFGLVSLHLCSKCTESTFIACEVSQCMCRGGQSRDVCKVVAECSFLFAVVLWKEVMAEYIVLATDWPWVTWFKFLHVHTYTLMYALNYILIRMY